MATKKRGAAKRSSAKKSSAKRSGVKRSGTKRSDARKTGAAKSGVKKSSFRKSGVAPLALGVETVLRRRSEGPEVDKLQEELCDLGYMTRAQKAQGPGKFGPLTEDALKHFQRDNFIDESGAYDEETQAAVRQLNDEVRRGNEGKVVRGLQNRLVSLGFMTLAQVSAGQGKFGPQTESALVGFQQSHGLNANGILTDETYRALLASAPSPTPAADTGNPTSIDTVLPAEGRGFTTYRREPGGADQVGRAGTIRGIMGVAEAWSALHSSPRLQIGDISRRRGGPFPPHASHQKGVDVDVRPITNNGREEPTNIHLATYSHDLTKELCQLIRRRVPGVRIFFNDPRLISLGLAQRLAGHDDHLHVRFPS
ncbi:MAG TPA: penicillin-insensitive murein endopeptidase [Pyrinomonadaceae bacterium]|nr:penicillin-insensitive murein endopeptidase [Pyrinomonadaceae bacterium]